VPADAEHLIGVARHPLRDRRIGLAVRHDALRVRRGDLQDATHEAGPTSLYARKTSKNCSRVKGGVSIDSTAKTRGQVSELDERSPAPGRDATAKTTAITSPTTASVRNIDA
jgi:hypothetical protein